MTERKLDIFKTLNAANARNAKYYEQLSDEEKKGFAPSVVARWMSGTSIPLQVMLINDVVNPYMFSLYKHPQLLWQLMTIANVGRNQRYQWHKLPNKKETGKSNAVRLLSDHLECSSSHAADALELLSKEQVVELAHFRGWPPEDITKLKRELKGAAGDDEDKPAKGKKAAKTDDLLEF